MKILQADVPINMETYLEDLKNLKTWCLKNGIILITCNLPKKKTHSRKHYVINFDADFGYLFVSAWVSAPGDMADSDKYKVFKSLEALKETILKTKYSRHHFENKRHVEEYIKGEVNKGRVV